MSGHVVKIIFVSSIPVFPPFGGNRARILTMINALREDGHQIAFALLTSRQMGEVDLVAHEDAFGSDFHYLKRRGISKALYLGIRLLQKNLRTTKRVLFGAPIFRVGSVDELYYRPFSREIRAILERGKFDAMIAEYIFSSKALELVPDGVLKILDTHDSFAGQVSTAEERRGLLRADVVLAIQEREADIFRSMAEGEATSIAVVSHIVPTQRPVDVNETQGATFFGSAFAANNTSLNWFRHEVLPHILEREPGFILNVAGSIGDHVVEDGSTRRIGRVPTIADAFLAAPISLNPIRAGTGLNIKLLDAMSLGVPTVSTTFGVRGVDPKFLGGVVVVPDDEPQAFANAVIQLFRDREQRVRLGRMSREAAAAWNDDQRYALKTVLSHRTTSARAD
jgi:glycosyltransferase involved in cell wall biosynthesis